MKASPVGIRRNGGYWHYSCLKSLSPPSVEIRVDAEGNLGAYKKKKQHPLISQSAKTRDGQMGFCTSQSMAMARGRMCIMSSALSLRSDFYISYYIVSKSVTDQSGDLYDALCTVGSRRFSVTVGAP